MPRFGVWNFQPFMDAADASGAAAPVAAPAPEVETSLAEHEAAFAPGAADPVPDTDAADSAPAAERRPDGTFKPRHRAKSQVASPEDSPRIQELTRRRHEAETERDATRAERDALRAERDALRAEREPTKPPVAEPEPARPAPARAAFPTFDEFQAIKGNENTTWDDYNDARTDWRYDQRKAAEQAEASAQTEQRTYDEHVTAYRDQLAEVIAAHPDFEMVTAAAPRVSKVIERAVIAVGPAAAYYLATHPEECAALTADTTVDPANPAFAATVAATKRYLSTLVASAQRPTSPSRAAAVSTGSALALVPATTPPKPPSPVRTGALHAADDPPGDGSSLAEHERFYVKTARR